MSAGRVKLTKSFIDQLELTPAIYRDVDLIGFAVRINTTYKTYVVEKRVHGKNVRATVGIHGQLTLAQARAKAQEMLLDMSRGINPTEVKKNDRLRALGDDELDASQPTLLDAYAIYCVERELAERTRSDYESVINNYLKDWREIKLKNITRKMIQDRHQSLSANSKAQANMAMRVFRAIYNFSIEHYLDDNEHPILPTSNPVSTLTAKRQWNKIKRRKTYINEDKLPTWVNSVLNFQGRGQQLETNKDFLLTLVLTGFRSEECASIAWDAIDLKYGFITSVDPKNGDPHTLPMGDFLWQLMKKRRRYVDGNWVFPSKKSATGHISNIAKVRDKINADCDVQFTFHDLRRTFASIAEGLDYGRYTIKRLLNHREDDDRDVTAGYIQVSDKKIRQAMNEIEQVIFADKRAHLVDEMKKK
ncbi:Site-specific recombinase XerD [Acinetobacter marinus]|uniref:Site-specific recombinase XerD n=1 Tax=Acinetobacter marinus TaxID=281375 RepID=A0A1G6J872_9GAMM|nr:integrase family protein [Acinetobacter marinus]SDC15054.1 Site-specific recombinase XerD [Acinetobacter marinus]